MKKFESFNSIVTPLDIINVDTDAIIPKQFLKSIKRTGFGNNLFDDWRYLDKDIEGSGRKDRKINQDFILNNKIYTDSKILLARENFGCGSSREHAPWALLDYGFQVIISSSFADIFTSNSFKNGLLLITLDKEYIETLFDQTKNDNNLYLNSQIIRDMLDNIYLKVKINMSLNNIFDKRKIPVSYNSLNNGQQIKCIIKMTNFYKDFTTCKFGYSFELYQLMILD